MSEIRVFIVDDHALFREGVAALLAREAGVVVVGEAEDAETAVLLAVELRPDIILMDLHLARGSGVDATRAILARLPTVRVIALTMYRDEELVTAVLQAGAQGYILKDAGGRELLEAVRAVAAGGAALSPPVCAGLLADYRHLAVQNSPGSQFSQRELAMLRLLARGASNPEIAETLSLSRQTVKNLLSELYGRLGAANRTEAVAVALARKLIPPRE